MEVLLRAAEAVRVKLLGRAPRWPVTFVVGPPRCGTTLVGLHLLRARRFATLCNAAKEHPRWPLLATRAALRRERAEFGYENRYGKAEGALAPSDGWDVIERHFESYREARAEDAPAASGLVKLVGELERVYRAPFLLKNNANSMRVPALELLFPGCLWIHVTRAYPEAAQSLLEARARHEVPLGKWWSAAPPPFLRHRFGSELEQVAATLWGLDRTLERELEAARAAGRARRVAYEEFCARPRELLEWLDARYRERGVALQAREANLPDRFEVSRLEPVLRAQLARALEPFLAAWEAGNGGAATPRDAAGEESR
jgi:hypothetical protein